MGASLPSGTINPALGTEADQPLYRRKQPKGNQLLMDKQPVPGTKGTKVLIDKASQCLLKK